jgi:hypothetical protein
VRGRCKEHALSIYTGVRPAELVDAIKKAAVRLDRQGSLDDAFDLGDTDTSDDAEDLDDTDALDNPDYDKADSWRIKTTADYYRQSWYIHWWETIKRFATKISVPGSFKIPT